MGPIVEIIISTCNDGIYRINRMLQRERNDVAYLIIHQVFNGQRYSYKEIFSEPRGDVRIITSTEKGLANSRNLGIKHAQGEILIPTDDDVVFNRDSFSNIKSAFDKYPSYDILTFQALTPEGQPRRRYRNKFFRHSRLTITRVSSIEIAIRRSTAVVEKGLRWDENFGLNQKYRGCLEIALMANALRAGIRCGYVPVPVVVHPVEASGRVYDLTSARTRGAVFKKIFGGLSFLLIPIFCIRQRKHIEEYASLWRFLWVMLREARAYRPE